MVLAVPLALRDLYDRQRVEKRLNSLIEHGGPQDCWPWVGPLGHGGYGQMSVRVQHRWRGMQVHRIAYLLSYGALPDPPLVVRHYVCGNRLCCNPAHLKAGTAQDNADDMERMGRVPRGAQHYRVINPSRGAWGDLNGSRTHRERRPRGERHPRTRLTAEDVRQIKQRRAQGVSQRAVAAMFGVSKTCIGQIDRGQTWAHVTLPATQIPLLSSEDGASL